MTFAGPSGGAPHQPLLRIRGIRKRFGTKEAVRPLDLEVARGEYLCILGPSGSGKSTLLRLVGGFELPDEGEIHLGGARIDTLPPEARDLHTVFQGYALFPHLSVFENVGFGLRTKGVRGGELTDRVEAALALVGLPGYGPRAPSSLSGGEQQRVALARALVSRPPLLLLDEPLAALDRRLRLRMQLELGRIQSETGIAFLHVTHDQEEALRLADRIAVMHEGRFLQLGPPGEVYRRPRTPFIAEFLGAANVLEGVAIGSSPPEIEVPGAGRLRVESFPDTLVEGRRATWAIRPEALRLHPAGAPDDPPVGLRARVEERHSLGGIEEFRVRAGELRLRVHVVASVTAPLPGPGDEVRVSVHPADVVPLEPDLEGD